MDASPVKVLKRPIGFSVRYKLCGRMMSLKLKGTQHFHNGEALQCFGGVKVSITALIHLTPALLLLGIT